MVETDIAVALASLEVATPDSEVVARARAHMLATLDEPLTVATLDEPLTDGRRNFRTVGERAVDDRVHPRVGNISRRRIQPWMGAVAAAVVILAVLASVALPNVSDDQQQNETAERAPETGTRPAPDGSGGTALDSVTGEQLPRLIQGRFSSTVLGGTVSFVTDGPMWLTRHEGGVVQLSLDPWDPLAAELTIARPVEPAEALGALSGIDYLRSAPEGLPGLSTPLVVGGVEAIYWRGRLAETAAVAQGCAQSEPCLMMYGGPVPIGVRPDVITDYVERPASDGGIVVMIAAIPFADYALPAFGAPFDGVIATISFVDDDTGGKAG